MYLKITRSTSVICSLAKVNAEQKILNEIYTCVVCMHVCVFVCMYISFAKRSNFKYLFRAITLSIHRNVIAGYRKRRKNN
jgi:hypothetical protein